MAKSRITQLPKRSDPNKPPEVIITDDPPPSIPPKTNGAFVWKNDSDEEVEEDVQIPDNEFERTEIMTINVRSCYSGTKRTEVRNGILEANPDVAIVTETWLQEGDQDLMVPGYIPIKRCDRKNSNGKKLPASRLMNHLKRHNRLSKQQHGYRPKMGCHTNLLEAWEKGVDMTDEHGPKIEVWSFDLQKAFDLLDHGKSLKLCHIAGINGNVGRCL